MVKKNDDVYVVGLLAGLVIASAIPLASQGALIFSLLLLVGVWLQAAPKLKGAF